jgi:hypothetical protein
VVLFALACGGRTLVQAWQTLNTDFPNYYLVSRLVHEKADTTRIFEWTWLQRQKDHHAIDQPLVGIPAVPPISTLAVYPFAGLKPLAAKRCWLALNAVLLIGTIYLLSQLTGLPYRRIALVAAFSLPLYANLLYGQYYLLLLFVLTLACWLYVHERRFLSGIAIAVAAALKIFPILYILYFLRKRDWKAIAGCLCGLAALAGASIAVFGWQLNRIFLTQMLSSPLRGEVINPYLLTSSSISALLHHLFIFEPQWNPHPMLHAPVLFAVLLPFLQMLVLAPMLLLIKPSEHSPQTISIEWSAILLTALAISTSPAFYHFTLLILPACIFLGLLLEDRRYDLIAMLFALYLLAGHRVWAIRNSAGWHAFLGVPRLYAMFLLCAFAAWFLLRRTGKLQDSTRPAWSIALALVLLINIYTGVRHQRGLYDDYANHLPAVQNSLLTGYPAIEGDILHAIALVPPSYRAISFDPDAPGSAADISLPDLPRGTDELSLAAGGDQLWIEEAGIHSTLVSRNVIASTIVDAETPVLSADHRQLAYLRERSGRARLWLHDLSQPNSADHPLTPPVFNVFEAAFAPNGDLVFSAMQGSSPVAIFRIDSAGQITPLFTAESRYPAISPDGRWLAYSRMQHGNWHLWLADLRAGTERPLTNAACDFTEPAWQSDSQTLLYATDCGRAPGLTALSSLRVVQ